MKANISNFRDIWNDKPVLRKVYFDYYKQIINACTNGNTLEIGGGSGNLKEHIEGLISIDIQEANWLDVVADAQCLPFKTNSINNIILFDVLHHIQFPKFFFSEASRILRPDGRIIILEPGITPISWLFYNFIHQEPVLLNANPLEDGIITSERDPYEANQAIPTLLFGQYRNEFEKLFPEFRIELKKNISLLAYPLSGGFKKWSLISEGMVSPILKLENKINFLLGKIMGFRLYVVLQKKSITSQGT